MYSQGVVRVPGQNPDFRVLRLWLWLNTAAQNNPPRHHYPDISISQFEHRPAELSFTGWAELQRIVTFLIFLRCTNTFTYLLATHWLLIFILSHTRWYIVTADQFQTRQTLLSGDLFSTARLPCWSDQPIQSVSFTAVVYTEFSVSSAAQLGHCCSSFLCCCSKTLELASSELSNCSIC